MNSIRAASAWFLAVVTVVHAGFVHPTAAREVASDAVETLTVCFVVRNPPDPRP